MSGILHLRSLPGPARPGPAIRLFLLALAVLLSCLSGPAAAQTFTRGEPVTGPMPGGSRPGNPLYDMPPGQTLLSAFGERPVFSPDGRKVAFHPGLKASAFNGFHLGGGFRCGLAERRQIVVAREGRDRRAVADDLCGQILGPSARGKSDHRQACRVGVDDGQRAAADRAGRTEDGEPLHAVRQGPHLRTTT